MIKNKIIKKIFLAIFLIIFFPVSCVQISRPFFKMKEQKYLKQIDNEIPDMFPVLVIWKDDEKYKVMTCYYKDLGQFTKNLGNFTYLVPKDYEASLNESLLALCRSQKKPYDFDWESPNPWFARFKVVKYFPDGSQMLEVESTWDDDRKNVGWYKAYDNKIIPQKHLLYFGPSVALTILPLSLLTTIILWAIVFFAIKLFKKRQKS